MSDIIHLLPDSVANQIAAGEVIQRPASVIKELVENSIDAGADYIQVIIKDAGRTLIQVIDNGKGMSETDARMAFERHATSKIECADDLFSLHTMGFRGEALASICAVAQVELRTRRADDELGTLIEISGSKVEQQQPISCPKGTVFSVKNLFFNVPARRKFLKTNATELNHIITEFNRIAIIYPHISFSLTHNDDEIYQLPEGSLKQRIVNIFGKSIGSQLLNINTETSLLTISGFIGRPESARKQMHNQYFFVNGRYMRHPYFHKAVMKAFESMLASETSPSYFICFNIDPANIDVNIHPTKTEIKFENEQAIWSILLSTVKEALGKFNVVPDIDFDTEGAMDMPVLNSSTKIQAPGIDFNPDYNPFKEASLATTSNSSSYSGNYKQEPFDWKKLYDGFQKDKTPESVQTEIILESHISDQTDDVIKGKNASTVQAESDYFQFKGKYILTSVKSGLMLIDQHRAHMRILFEQYLKFINCKKGLSQQILFPELIDLNAEDCLILEEIKEDLSFVGFDMDKFGKNTYRINGVPTSLEGVDCLPVLQEMLAAQKENTVSGKVIMQERIALSLAKAAAIPYGKILSVQEITNLIDSLFACENHNYSPDGKPIINILSEGEIENRF